MKKEDLKIINVKELLQKENICIPLYQRPYKWTLKHVNQLIDDIVLHREKSAYRLGTIVFQQDEKGKLNIVDGQQRSITLLLIALAIKENQGNLKAEMARSQIKPMESEWFSNLKFTNLISLNNIRDNYNAIERRVHDFDVSTVQFFYEHCKLVQVILTDVSEAFQFFDSQNSRGKDLAPHDLLKAFHLREMMEVSSEKERITSVNNWENLESHRLEELFGEYLFRIRKWSKGYHARHFTKDEIQHFKGVSPQIKDSFPFAKLHRISHFYVDAYNNENNQQIDQHPMAYPFQIDQVIINGKRFFELVDHYSDALKQLKLDDKLQGQAKKIYETLDSYDARWRTGDQYVRTLFDCCLLYYIDKFGYVEIDRAVEKIFIWAYRLRLEWKNVQLASMDNYALGSPYMFKKIREALHPAQVLNIQLEKATKSATKVDEIVNLFKEMKYV